MKTLIHLSKTIAVLVLAFCIIGFMLEAAFKLTLSLLSMAFWGLILLGIYGLGQLLIRGLARHGGDRHNVP
jgi:hypothetical protein